MGFVILTSSICCGCASHTSRAVHTQPHCTAAELALLGCMSHKQGLVRLRCITLTPAISVTTCCAGPQSQGHHCFLSLHNAAAGNLTAILRRCLRGQKHKGVHGLYRGRRLYLLAHKMLRDADRSRDAPQFPPMKAPFCTLPTLWEAASSTLFTAAYTCCAGGTRKSLLPCMHTLTLPCAAQLGDIVHTKPFTRLCTSLCIRMVLRCIASTRQSSAWKLPCLQGSGGPELVLTLHSAALQRSVIVSTLLTQPHVPRRAQKREEVLSQRRNPGAPLTVCLLPLSGGVDLPRLWGDLVAACRPEEAQPPVTPRANRPQGMELEEEHLPTREQGAHASHQERERPTQTWPAHLIRCPAAPLALIAPHLWSLMWQSCCLIAGKSVPRRGE